MNHVDQGGAALALYDLICEIKALYPEKYRMIVITGKHNQLNKNLSGIGIENYSAPFKNFLSSYRKPALFWRMAIIIRYWANKYRAVRRIESMVDFHNVNIIHSNLDRIDIGAYFSKKYGIPHLWHIRENGKGDFKLMSVFHNPVRHILKYPSQFVTISKVVTRQWIKYGLPESQIHLVYDGVRTEYLKEIKREYSDKVRFVFLGGYSQSKGQHLFLEALALLSNVIGDKITVDFYGNGEDDYFQELAMFLDDNKLDKFVRLLQYDPEIYQKLGKYDVGVNCSANEGFGRITVEYMMAGLCPLVSDTGANCEIVENGKTGIVFEYNKKNDLVFKIKELLSNQNNIVNLGKSARDYALKNFSMEKHAKEIVGLYDSLL